MKKLLSTLLILLATASSNVSADDIFKGMRGPTNLQADIRTVYSKNKIGTRAVTNTLIGKYWDGDKSGKWGFIGLPYKFVHSKNGYVKGLGDILIGFGPRGRIGNLHWFLYGGATLPIGDTEGKIKLGNGRYDIKLGTFATLLSSDKKFHIDGSLEYNFTGKEALNEISTGMVAGAKVTDKLRSAAGLTYFNNGNGHSVNSRGVVRYTHSEKLHFELVGDYGIGSNGTLSKSNSIGLFTRYNF